MLKIAYHTIYKHSLPDGHRFPMEKYDLLPQQLVYEGTCNEENFFEPEVPNNKYFFIVHDAEYVSDLMNLTLNQKAARKIGFPLNEDLIEKIIGIEPFEIYQGRDDILAIVNSETMVRNLEIDFELLKKINVRGLIVSARGDHCDFVSRCFFPGTGVNEDPVTGSAHTTLTPYWSKKLNKKELCAIQLSERGGVLSCEDKGERIIIGGKAVLYMKGKIYI